MRKKMIILSILLCFNLVISQEYPAVMPPEVIEAGAAQEFLDIYCLMAQYNVQRFIQGVQAVKDYFNNISSELNLTVSLTEIDSLKDSIINGINDVCTANETNFGLKIQGLIDLLNGSEGIEVVLRSVGTSFETQLYAKQDEFNEEKLRIDSEKALIDAEAANLTGSLTIEEHALLTSQVESITNEINDLVAQAENGGTPEEINALLSQIDSKRVELDSITSQLLNAASEAEGLEAQANQLKARAEVLKSDAESFKAYAEAYGAKAESLFSDIEDEIRTRLLDQGNYSNLLAQVNEKQQALFNKIMDYQSGIIDQKEAELTAHGIEVQAFSELKSYLKTKRSQAMSLLVGEVNPESINQLTSEMESQINEYKNEIISEATNKVVQAFFPELTELETRLDEGLEKARALGFNTTQLEQEINELKNLKASAQELAIQGSIDEAFAMIEIIKPKFEQVKKTYHELKAQGEQTRLMVESFINEVESVIPIISDGVEQASEAGLDLYGLDLMLEELRSHGDMADQAFNQGDLSDALSYIDKARNTYDAIKISWDKLRGMI